MDINPKNLQDVLENLSYMLDKMDGQTLAAFVEEGYVDAAIESLIEASEKQSKVTGNPKAVQMARDMKEYLNNPTAKLVYEPMAAEDETEIALHIRFIGGRNVEVTISTKDLSSFFAQIRYPNSKLVTLETKYGTFMFAKEQIESVNVFEIVAGAAVA